MRSSVSGERENRCPFGDGVSSGIFVAVPNAMVPFPKSCVLAHSTSFSFWEVVPVVLRVSEYCTTPRTCIARQGAVLVPEYVQLVAVYVAYVYLNTVQYKPDYRYSESTVGTVLPVLHST